MRFNEVALDFRSAAGQLLGAAAQPGFPVDKSYKAISISGFDVQNKGLSLTVSKGSGGDLRGAGNAGCNNWSAGVILRDDQVGIVHWTSSRPGKCAANR